MIQEFYSEYEYQISFIIGLISIAYFCYRQITSPYEDIVTQRFSFAKGLGPRAYVGRGLINEATIYYFILVSLSYATVCFSEAIYKFVFIDNVSGGSNPAPAFDSSSGTWPLTVAVLIVGLSPDFPFLKEVEFFFRGVARRAAGIPSNFLKALQNVNNFDFVLISKESDEALDIYEEVTLLHLFDCMQGTNRTDAAEHRERLYRALMLARWMFADTAESHWSLEGLTRARAASTIEREDALTNIEGLRSAVKNIKDTDFYKELVEVLKTLANVTPTTSNYALFRFENKDSPELIELWNRYEKDLAPFFDEATQFADKILNTTDDLENGFSVLFLNEGAYNRKGDSALSKLCDHVSSFQSQVQRNIIVWIIFWAIIVSFMFGSTYFFLREYLRNLENPEFFDLLQMSVRIGWQHSLGVFVIIFFSMLGASIFERVTYGSRISSSTADGVAPIMYFIGLMSSAILFSYSAQIALWAVFNLEDNVDWGLFLSDASAFLPDVLIWTAFGPVFSVFLFAWLKRIDPESSTKFHTTGWSRKVSEAVLASLASAAVPLVGYLIFHEASGSDILLPYADGNKVLKISLALLTPLTVLALISGQLSRVSDLRARSS